MTESVSSVTSLSHPKKPTPNNEVQVKKLDNEFQDWLLIEAIEVINSIRPIIESIADCYEYVDGHMELKDDADLEGAVTHNIDPIYEHRSLEDFAQRFHRDQYDRIKEKYGEMKLDEYMNHKAIIYELTQPQEA